MKVSQARPWYLGGVLYQVYPLSFADSNGDGFGDIRGIIDHLDYLGGSPDSLGVSAIWMSPVYRSPMADWGYDVADHRAIDPRFGTMADFDRLVSEVHARGMKLLLDFVPNHTSIEHPWFTEARRARSSAKRDWYIWADPKSDGSPPNNWLSSFGGSAWTLDPKTGQYYLHTFLPEQPDLNWRNADVRAAMNDVLRFWLDRGVDGFRTDAVYDLIKDINLRDDPPNPTYRPGIDDPADSLLKTKSSGQDELIGLLDTFCDTIADDHGSLVMSEAYLNVPAMHRLYQACKRHPIHAPFNFNLMYLPWSAENFSSFINAYEASLGEHDLPNYVLGNHDRRRLVSRVGAPRAKLLAMLQMTLRGLAVVYYGDELGVENGVISREQERDPWGKRVPGLGLGRDSARTPMPWSAETHSGFSTGTPWLPLAPHSHARSVAVEQHDPESFLHLYRHLIHLKRTLPALAEGRYEAVRSNNPNCYVFMRVIGPHRCLVVLNFADSVQRLDLKGFNGTMVASTANILGVGGVASLNQISLNAHEGRVYELEGGES